MNHRSLRASPAGSTASWCHCSIRWVLVKLPFFSVCAAAGRKNTSVPMSCVRISPVSISGPFCQKRGALDHDQVPDHQPVQVGQASRCIRPLAEPTAGFWPNRK